MSERQIPDSTITKQLKTTYRILRKQGHCHGSWWAGTKSFEHTLGYCVEGALQLATRTKFHREMNNKPVYLFLLAEAKKELLRKKTFVEWGKSWFIKSSFTEDWARDSVVHYLQKAEDCVTLHMFNDHLGQRFIFPLLEKAIAKSEAMDKCEFAKACNRMFKSKVVFKIDAATRKRIEEFDLVA